MSDQEARALPTGAAIHVFTQQGTAIDRIDPGPEFRPTQHMAYNRTIVIGAAREVRNNVYGMDLRDDWQAYAAANDGALPYVVMQFYGTEAPEDD